MWIWTFGALNVAIVIASFAAGHAVGGDWITVDRLSITHVVVTLVTLATGYYCLHDSREVTNTLPRVIRCNGREMPCWIIAAAFWFAGVGVAPFLVALGISGPPATWHSALVVAYPLAWFQFSRSLGRLVPEIEIVRK